jgi:hypothetical protein
MNARSLATNSRFFGSLGVTPLTYSSRRGSATRSGCLHYQLGVRVIGFSLNKLINSDDWHSRTTASAIRLRRFLQSQGEAST